MPRRRVLEPPKRRQPPAKRGTSGSSQTTTTKKRSGQVVDEKTDNQMLPESESMLNPAHVTVGGSVTKNLGDYESAKVAVQITRPCFDTDEAIEHTYSQCAAWVDTKIREELAKVYE